MQKLPLLLSEERKMLRILSSVTMAARGLGFRARAGRDGWVWRWKEEGAVVAAVVVGGGGLLCRCMVVVAPMRERRCGSGHGRRLGCRWSAG